MEDYFKANQALWDQWTAVHAESEFYDVEGFKAGRMTLDLPEREALGDVAGKSLLHLQCHFGLDTLSWARLGARVTGVDFSGPAIELAHALSAELDIPAAFVRANVYELPDVLDTAESFDIVFTSHGVLAWLPDLARWAEVIAHFLKPGGTFYIIDMHPTAYIFENEGDTTEFKIVYPYFNRAPLEFEVTGSYADPDARIKQDVQYEWAHSMGEIVNALIGAGLRIQKLEEFPFIGWAMFPAMMQRGEDGFWRIKDAYGAAVDLPLMFAATATKGIS